jgi:hypothetical protein
MRPMGHRGPMRPCPQTMLCSALPNMVMSLPDFRVALSDAKIIYAVAFIDGCGLRDRRRRIVL